MFVPWTMFRVVIKAPGPTLAFKSFDRVAFARCLVKEKGGVLRTKNLVCGPNDKVVG